MAIPTNTFEDLLNQDLTWALHEGSEFFLGRGHVQRTLRKISQALQALNVPYAVCGGMALFAYGYRRFTEDVNIVVNQVDLPRIHAALCARGYLAAVEARKNLRDTETKVKIEFLIAGQFPGDGKPKPVAFPDPEFASSNIDGVSYVRLERLVEMKLASGISAAHRRKDLGDVQELIRILQLPQVLANSLDPYVRDMYLQLWQEVADAPAEE